MIDRETIALTIVSWLCLLGAGTILCTVLRVLGYFCSYWLIAGVATTIEAVGLAFLCRPSKIERLEKKIKKLREKT